MSLQQIPPSSGPQILLSLEELKLSMERKNICELEFFQVLKTFCENYAATGSKDWSCLLNSIDLFHECYLWLDASDMFYDFIFGVIEDAECDDIFTIRFCLHTYFDQRVYGRGFTRCQNRLYFDESSDIGCFFQLDFTMMQRLSRYGVALQWKDAENPYHMIDVLSNLRNYLKSSRMDVEQEDRTRLALQKMTNSTYSSAFRRQRMRFIVLTIGAMTQRHSYFRLDSVKCLKLLFETIPDPYLTTSEMAGFLEEVFMFEVFREDKQKETKVRRLCDDFEETFPTVKQTLQPRTLQHLSRCRVRQALVEAKGLLIGVRHLPVPKKIQKYVSLELEG